MILLLTCPFQIFKNESRYSFAQKYMSTTEKKLTCQYCVAEIQA